MRTIRKLGLRERLSCPQLHFHPQQHQRPLVDAQSMHLLQIRSQAVLLSPTRSHWLLQLHH